MLAFRLSDSEFLPKRKPCDANSNLPGKVKRDRLFATCKSFLPLLRSSNRQDKLILGIYYISDHCDYADLVSGMFRRGGGGLTVRAS